MNGASQPGEFSKATFKTFLLRLLSQACTIAAGVIIARALGPAGKGSYTYAVTVLGLLVTLGTGASAVVSRQYGRLKVPSGIVYSAMMRFFFVVCIPVTLLVALVAILTRQPILIPSAVAFPFAYLNQVSIGFSLAEGKVGFANRQSLATSAALTVVAGILCYVLHLGITALLWGWVGVNAAITVYSLMRITKYRGKPGDSSQRAQVFREQCSFGFRVTFNQLLALLNFQVDVFIVLFALGHAALGRYGIALGIGMTMWQLSRPLTVTSYGKVTSGTPKEAAGMTVLCVRHALFSVGIACIVLLFAGPWLLQVVYGPAFAPSGRALQLLLPGIVTYCSVPFFAQYFTMQLGKPGINTAVTAMSTILCAIITYALVHKIGIAAGAIGTSVSYTAAFLFCAVVFCRSTGTALSSLFAFSIADLDRYRVLANWILSGLRLTPHAKLPE